MSVRAAVALLAATCAACATAQPRDDADRIAREALLVDTHIDVPYRLQERWQDVSVATEAGDFDHPRAAVGGLDVAFMSIYIPASAGEGDDAHSLAESLIDSVEKMAADAPDKFRVVRSADEAERAKADGRVALALGMENGAPIAGDLERLRHYAERGIRYVTLAHSASNHIADSSYDENRQWNGLSPFGRELVAEMNRLGVMIDVSHVSDEAFHDVIRLSRAPVIASHSSARHFTPGFERNMSDEMIRALAGTGGTIQINFGSSFVTEAANRWFNEFRAARAAWSAGGERTADEAAAFEAGFKAANPYPFATLDDVLDHFDHVVQLVGIDHVGIGSDYDGVGDSLPEGLKDVASYPNLVRGLLGRGYTRADIEKVLGGNLMRVWRANESGVSSGSN